MAMVSVGLEEAPAAEAERGPTLDAAEKSSQPESQHDEADE